jgi:TonB-linked SusC/RagA family outer membrane protein
MKKILTVLFLITIVLSGVIQVYGQQKKIVSGRVIDSSDKTAIVGATIGEYDKEQRVVNGTITNIDGDFVLQMKEASNIVKVNFVGYEMQQISTEKAGSVVVELKSAVLQINEVTIKAEAKSNNQLTNIEDRDKASSSVKIDMMEMQNQGVVSAADALQGKVSGLDIVSASGDPGAGSQLVIRGMSSLGNSKPLIVVDGIPQFNVGSNFDLSSAEAEDISILINMALQDIKSIEVLKDAASTAIYGSRGADGVLLIETHKGKMGKVRFNYQFKSSLNVQPDAIPMLDGDEYIMLQQEEWHNLWGTSSNIPREISYDVDYFDFYNYSANTDWIKEITRNGATYDHYLSASGGGAKTRYFTSLNYVSEGGTTLNTSSKRFSSRVNLDYFLSQKLLFQVKFDYNSTSIEGNIGNVREMAYIKSPNMSVWEHDAQGNLTGEYFTPVASYQGNGVAFYNPVAVANLSQNDRVIDKLENTFMLQYRLNKWVTFRETVSFQYQGTKAKSFMPYNAVGADWLSPSNNRSQETNTLDQALRTETQVSFNSMFSNPKHQLYGAFSWVTENSSYDLLYMGTNKTPSTDILDPGANSNIGGISTGTGENRLMSAIPNINYKYDEKYMIQTLIRADAHSSFGSSNRWGVFKGLSFGWRFSNEEFMKNLSFLNEGMLRASWGVSGRQPGDVYARFATFDSKVSYMMMPAIAPSRVQLDNLSWEEITSYNVGFELTLFDNRVFLESDVYRKVTSDILFDGYSIPLSTGYDNLRYYNGGEMTNTGWELMSDFKILRQSIWNWSVYFNAANNVNSFSKLPENFNPERSTSIGNEQYPIRVVEGDPIGSFFGFRYLGVWSRDEDVVARDENGDILYDREGLPIPLRYTDTYTFKGGDPIYEDINHDGKIDINDAVYIGDSNPLFVGGFGSNLKYKRLNLSVSFNYRLGYDIINMIAMQTEGMNSRNNQSKAVLNRWRVQGQNEPGMLPRAYMNHPANNLGSDRYVENGDYVRLNNITLSYMLDNRICRKLHLSDVNLALSARKLFTFTNYSGQDPEVGQDASNPFWVGVDYARTPPPKIMSFNLSVGF